MPKEAYKMPAAYVGMPVSFYLGASRTQEPALGIVTQVGENTLSLVCFSHDSFNVEPHVGVRHCDDPCVQNTEIGREAGGWDFCEATHKLPGLFTRVAEMEKRVSHLEERLRPTVK